MYKNIHKVTLTLAIVLFLPIFAQANGLPVFTDLAATAGKSVVFISTESTSTGSPQAKQFRQQVPDGHPFKDFFERFDQFFGQQPGQQRKQRGQGSGFVISADGLIVTNNHVINGADKVTVKFHDNGKEFPAKIIGSDKETDLAVLKVEVGKKLPVLRFGNSDSIKVGEWVLAIGNPYGLEHTVTAGIISAKYRNLRVGPFDNFLQTDASINPGNSGGPLLNMKGEVIGINTLINAAGQNLGFAVPSNQAKEIITHLKKGESFKRGWLGVTIQPVSENQAKALGLEKATGALIASVGKGHPADKGGVRQGDVVLAVNGKNVADSTELLRVIASLKPGDKAKLTLWRNGSKVNRTVVLGQRGEKSMASMQRQPSPKLASVLGLQVKQVNDKEANALGLEKTQGLLVVQVAQGSPATNEDIRQGDVIIQANQQDVNSVKELEAVIKRDKKRGAVMLLIKRQGQNLFVALPLDEN